jgi:hypothetical protein
MKIDPLAAIATIVLITLPLDPSLAGDRPSSIPVNHTPAKRQYYCQQPSEIPLPPGYKSIKPNQIWCGEVKKELRQAAPANGYIVDRLEWSKLWKTYRGNEELPKVNFDREVILLYVHSDANTLNMVPVLSPKGDLLRATSFTEQGMSRDSPCSYMFMSVDRQGVKTIEGKSLVRRSNINSSSF